MKDEHVKDAAQGAAEDVPQDVAPDFAFDAQAARALPPRHRRRSICAARAETRAQLGSSVAFGSDYGQALPGAAQSASMMIVSIDDRRLLTKRNNRSANCK